MAKDQDAVAKALAKKLGVDSLEEVNSDKAKEVFDEIKSGKYSLDEFKVLLSHVPNFVSLAISFYEQLVNVTKAGSESQKEIIAGLRDSIATLKVLAERAENDATRDRIGQMVLDGMRLLADVNKDNSRLWAGVAVVGISALAVVGVLTGRISPSDAAKMIGNRVA
jgi:hypothetical protein